MLSQLRPALVVLALLSVLTGLVYPAAVTGVSRVAFRQASSGMLIEKGGHVVGSELIGQPFTDPAYFWSRPSATGPFPYNAAASSGSNQGPTNPAFIEAVAGRVKALREADPGNDALVPIDLVTASGSGLDPHISPAAALYQAGRVARLRGLPVDRVKSIVDEQTESRTLGFMGAPRVNVLRLNLALDALGPRKAPAAGT